MSFPQRWGRPFSLRRLLPTRPAPSRPLTLPRLLLSPRTVLDPGAEGGTGGTCRAACTCPAGDAALRVRLPPDRVRILQTVLFPAPYIHGNLSDLPVPPARVPLTRSFPSCSQSVTSQS